MPWPEDPKADPKTGASYFVSDLYLGIESVHAEDGQGCGCTDTATEHYSGCIPAFWMASYHKVRSERRKSCTSSRVPPPLKTPLRRKSSLTPVRARMSFRSLFTRANASCGVRVGASNANHPTTEKARHRFRDGRNSVETGETIPRHSDDSQPIAPKVAGHRGYAIDVDLSSSRDRVLRGEGAALVGDIDDIDTGARLQHLAGDVLQIPGSGGGERELPGFARAKAINSAVEFIGSARFTAIMKGLVPMLMTGTKSRSTSMAAT